MKTKILQLLLICVTIFYSNNLFSQTKQALFYGGIYLHREQQEVMGYLADWNANKTENRVIVCAHRGLWGYYGQGKNGTKTYYPAENTLQAISHACYNNAEMIELDIKTTWFEYQEGKYMSIPYLNHDYRLGRLATNPANVKPSYDVNNWQAVPAVNNKHSNQVSWDELKHMYVRTYILNGTGFRFTDVSNNKTYYDNQPQSCKFISLDQALAFIKQWSKSNPKSVPVIQLDIKSVYDAQKCLEVVRKHDAYDWVIFKIKATLLYDASAKGKELNGFINGMQFKKVRQTKWGGAGISESKLIRVIPSFSLEMGIKIPLINAYDLLKKQDWFYTMEVNVKEGGIGTSRNTDNNRYYDVAALANENQLKLQIFHAVPEAGMTPDYFNDYEKNRYFDVEGKGTYTLSRYYTKKAKSRQTSNIIYDRDDKRSILNFLVNLTKDAKNNWDFRCVITDDFFGVRSSLNSIGAYGGILPAPTSLSIDAADNTNTQPFAYDANSETIMDNELYYYAVPKISCATKLAGSGVKTASNAATTALINANRYIYTYTDSTNLWKNLSKPNYGLAIDIAVSNNGNIWHVGTNNKLYANNGDYDSVWNYVASPLCKKIAIGGLVDGSDNVNFESIAIIDTYNSIYTRHIDSTEWQKVAGTNAKEVAVDKMGDTWFIASDNKIYKIEGGDSLVYTNGLGTKIACGDDGSIIILGLDKNIWGYNTTTYKWQIINYTSGAYAEISLTNAAHAVAVKTNGEIWRLDDDCNESSTAATTLTTNQTSVNAVNDALEISKISIFPNPAHDKVTVQLPQGMESATVTIISSLGTTIATDNSAGLLRQISIAGKPSGTYLVRVTTKEGVSTTQKLIVQ